MIKRKSTELMCFINCVAYGKDGKNIQRLIDRWVECSGLEWTNTRLKALKDVALHIREGRNDLAIEICQANSIAHRNGLPKGPFKKPISEFIHSNTPKDLKRSMAVLRTYTALRLPTLSETQSNKIQKSITSKSDCYGLIPAVVLNDNIWYDYNRLKESMPRFLRDKASSIENMLFQATLLVHGVDVQDDTVKILKSCVEAVHVTFPEEFSPLSRSAFTRLKNRSEFSLDRLRPFTSCYSPRSMKIDRDSEIPYCKAVHSLLTTSYLPPSLDSFIPLYDTRKSLTKLNGEDQYVGKVHVIQSPGCKGRAVAIPNAWIQMAFLPLHLCLEKVQKSLDNTMVYDQNKGAYQAITCMQEHGSVYSSDLSSATDRFPLFLQTEWLRHNGLEPYAKGIEDLCHKPWKFIDHNGDEKSLTYNCGQPMGLYGSFPLFNITHSLLCMRLEANLPGKCLDPVLKQEILTNVSKSGRHSPYGVYEVSRTLKDAGFWRESSTPEPVTSFSGGTSSLVLGDDVIFSDGKLKELYDRTLTKLGVEVAPEKCYSGHVSEFAGFLIMKTDQTVIAFRPLKIDGEVHDKLNQLSLFDSLGSDLKKLKPSWAHKFEIYGKTRGLRNLDLSPAISDEKDFVSAMQLNNDYFLRVVNLLYGSQCQYPDYSLIAKSEPIIYDGFKETAIASPLRYTGNTINYKREKLEREYSPSQFSTDPLIKRVKEGRLSLFTANGLDPVIPEGKESPQIEQEITPDSSLEVQSLRICPTDEVAEQAITPSNISSERKSVQDWLFGETSAEFESRRRREVEDYLSDNGYSVRPQTNEVSAASREAASVDSDVDYTTKHKDVPANKSILSNKEY